ncbi:MAG: hypothetical protein OHK0046_35940 [Anaerolineae bacterium]
MKLTCADLVTYLSDYIDNNLDEDLIAAAREHLATCHNCSIVLDSTQKMILLYRERAHTPAQSIPAERQTRLYDQLAAAFLEKKP